MFHRASSNIFTFMTEDTFQTTQRRHDKGKHYLCGGASFNPDLSPQFEQIELGLPGVLPEAEKWIAKSREQLSNAVHVDVGEIAGHILVLFGIHDDKLLSVRAVRLTHNLEISTEEEDWSRYIKMPYTTEQMVKPYLNSDDEEELLVELL